MGLAKKFSTAVHTRLDGADSGFVKKCFDVIYYNVKKRYTAECHELSMASMARNAPRSSETYHVKYKFDLWVVRFLIHRQELLQEDVAAAPSSQLLASIPNYMFPPPHPVVTRIRRLCIISGAGGGHSCL